MNGAPLENRHGFPLRAVVPGRYGEQSPKWLTRIEVVDHPYTGGLYQSQGWASTQVATTSRINQPSGSAPLGPVQVAGFAFAGIRGIQKVELSADDGMTWHTATLMPPLSDQSWVFWTWLWTPPRAGPINWWCELPMAPALCRPGPDVEPCPAVQPAGSM